MGESGGRSLWLDWQRGLAVLFMVAWHTWDAWRAEGVTQTDAHALVNLIGGMAAPSFLYVAGLSLVLGDAALARRGLSARARRGRALRRGIWLLGVAYLFRLAEYLLGGAFLAPGGWRDLLRVDVLNVIAVSFLLAATMTVGVGRRLRIALAIAATAAFVALAPVVAGWEHAPSRVLDYLYSEWPRGNFYLFPWAGFCFAGCALGALVAARPPEGRATGAWGSIALGALLLAVGQGADALPPVYAHQDFWHTSPSWFAVRLGIVVTITGALQLLPSSADHVLSWLRCIGRHSLLGYFLSVEIPYGLLSRSFHRRLEVGSVRLGVLAMLVLIWALSMAADRYDRWRASRSPQVPPGTTGPVATV